MADAQQKIRDIINDHGGDWRQMSEPELGKIADLTWDCQATYGDLIAIGGTILRDRVWRQENIRFKARAKQQIKETGTLDLSHRKGIEMAWEST